MRIVVAGGSGFLGRPLMRELRQAGHEVTQLVRRPATLPEQLSWDPAKRVDLPDDTSAVINLCGAGIEDHRWTRAYKQEIRDSRVNTTGRLAKAVARQRIPLLINASGVDYYGDTGDREVDESGPPGSGFLPDLVRDWEAATGPATEHSRVVLLRTGMPLHKSGGLLKPQLLPFKLGIAGRFGSGRQWVPWISLHDWLRAVAQIVEDHRFAGPVNLVGPAPVTNSEFTKALAAALRRPALLPIPRLPLRVLLGEMANEPFRSRRVLPKVLRDNDFNFQMSTLEAALKAALG